MLAPYKTKAKKKKPEYKAKEGHTIKEQETPLQKANEQA